MNFGQSFRLAIKSLMASKARALLTMLGIIIGVAAVIIIISLGDGMQNMVNEQFESMGTNMLVATIIGRSSSRQVRDEDMFALVEKNPDLLAQPVGSIRSSMWFWRTNGLNQLADAGLFREITKKINGGTNHIEKRHEYLLRAENVLRKF